MREACLVDLFGITLGEATRYQSTEQISNHDAADSAVRFLEGDEAA